MWLCTTSYTKLMKWLAHLASTHGHRVTHAPVLSHAYLLVIVRSFGDPGTIVKPRRYCVWLPPLSVSVELAYLITAAFIGRDWRLLLMQRIVSRYFCVISNLIYRFLLWPYRAITNDRTDNGCPYNWRNSIQEKMALAGRPTMLHCDLITDKFKCVWLW